MREIKSDWERVEVERGFKRKVVKVSNDFVFIHDEQLDLLFVDCFLFISLSFWVALPTVKPGSDIILKSHSCFTFNMA